MTLLRHVSCNVSDCDLLFYPKCDFSINETNNKEKLCLQSLPRWELNRE